MEPLELEGHDLLKYSKNETLDRIKSIAADTLNQRRSELHPDNWVSENTTDLVSEGHKVPSNLHLVQRGDRTEKLSISFSGDLKPPLEIEFDANGNISKALVKEVTEGGEGVYRELTPQEYENIFSNLSIPEPKENLKAA